MTDSTSGGTIASVTTAVSEQPVRVMCRECLTMIYDVRVSQSSEYARVAVTNAYQQIQTVPPNGSYVEVSWLCDVAMSTDVHHVLVETRST